MAKKKKAKKKPIRKSKPDPTQSALTAVERIIGGPLVTGKRRRA